MTLCNLKKMSYEEKKAVSDEKLRVLRLKLHDSAREIKSFHAHVPDSMERLYLEVLVGETTSHSKRIKLKCLDCSGFSRDEVTNCTMRQCSLHAIRPFQKKK